MAIFFVIFTVFVSNVKHAFSTKFLRHHSSSNCSKFEAEFQWNNFDLAKVSICDRETPWRLAHLVLQDAEIFLDVGGNLGYKAALFFGLWSPGTGFNRLSLKTAIENSVKHNISTNKKQLDTVCADGWQKDVPIVCSGDASRKDDLYGRPPCQIRRPMQVFSFDGDLTHVENQRKSIYDAFPHLNPLSSDGNSEGPAATWEYIHAAMTTSERATQWGGVGYFEQRGDEGGKLRNDNNTEFPTMLVPLMSVDTFCAQRNISAVDVLKIDVEGHDADVIEGAKYTLLNRGVSLVAAECTSCAGPHWQKVFGKLDRWGFQCYIGGENELMFRMTGCFDASLIEATTHVPDCFTEVGGGPLCAAWRRGLTERVDGNVYCAHRGRAHGLLALFDGQSLYRYAQRRRGNWFAHHLVGRLGVRLVNNTVHLDEHDIVEWERDTGRRRSDGALDWPRILRQCGCSNGTFRSA